MPTSTPSAAGTSPAKAKSGVRPRRDFAGMETRRMRAADLFAKGVSQADIGRELEVSHQTVSDWHEKWVGRREAGTKEHRPTGSSAQGERGRPGQGGPGPGKGPQGQRVPDRAVDAGPSGRRDREGDRGEIPPRARLAGTPTDGMEPSASGPASRRARRRGHRAAGSTNAGPR